jgi:hypothetical protein
MKLPRYPLLWLLLAVVAIKGALFAWGWHVWNPAPGTLGNWLSIWDHWDADAYKIIATQGYFPEGIAEAQKAFVRRFPPLYPYLIRAVAELFNQSIVVSGIAISVVCVLASSALLYRLCLDEGLKTRQAVAAVLLFSVYPTSLFTNSVYSESLFICCVLVSFVALRRDWFWLAGLGAAGALLTRVVGVAMFPAIAIALFQRWRQGRLRWFDLSGLAIPAVAMLGYMLMNAWLFGSPTHFVREYQSAPSPMSPQWPMQEAFVLAWGLLQKAWTGQVNEGYMMHYGWNPVFTFFCLGTVLVWLRARPRWDLVAYALTYVLLFTMFRFNFSYPRYTYAVIPMFIAFGQLAPPFVQVCLGGMFTALLLRFVIIFVNGGWTF